MANSRATRKELLSWMLFDFANSSYTTLIVTIVFPIFFKEIIVGETGDGAYLWAISIFISQILVVISAPVLGAFADYSATKKRMLLVTYLGCVASTALLGITGPNEIILGMTLFIVSNLFFSLGENLIAAFLPEITTPEKMGRVSGFGWALGYSGGLLSIAVCYPFIHVEYIAENTSSFQLSFVVVALFFFLGGLPTFLFLKERATARKLASGMSYAAVGFRRVLKTLSNIREYRQLFRFMLVFFTYNCGIAIVITFAGIYANEAINMGGKELSIFFMVVQVSAALGALAFGFLQDWMGSKKPIILSLFIWLSVCIGAYYSTSAWHFYMVGNLAGIAMGSSQSGARALIGTFTPVNHTGEFFGFWGLFWKLSFGIGPLFYGTFRSSLGVRQAILVTSLFFILGIIGMIFVNEQEGRSHAKSNQ